MAISGDAIHGSTPRQGAATGEETYLLCSLLGDGSGPISRRRTRAFEAYVAIRSPQSQEVVKTGREAGEIYAFAGLAGIEIGKVRFDLLRRYLWILEQDLDDEIEKARALLRDMQRPVIPLRGPIKQGMYLGSAVHKQRNCPLNPGETSRK